MKKVLVSMMLLLASTGLSFAYPNGGFKDKYPNIYTVSEALKMKDNSYVTVQGNIVRRISGDKYTFKDSTGTITVEIDHNKWNGITADSSNLLELSGEIEKDFTSTKLDVETVKRIK